MRALPGTGAVAPLATVSRGGRIESLHFGCVAVADACGDTIACAGDPALPVYWRSLAKPFHAFPLIAGKAPGELPLTERELAVICASHNGEPQHIACVRSVLNHVGLDETALRCGACEPAGKDPADDLVRRGEAPRPVHNMCSGNHAGLLALTVLLEGAVQEYDLPTSATQMSVAQALARFSGMSQSLSTSAIDGCGIPTTLTPLSSIAVAFARLMAPPRDWPGDTVKVCGTITQAMMAHPDLVSGAGELDTEFMRAWEGKAIAKLGAEGLCAVAFSASERWPLGVAIVIKVADGLGKRALPTILRECLQQLGIGSSEHDARWLARFPAQLKNHRGETVGELGSCFQLEFNDTAEPRSHLRMSISSDAQTP